MLAQSIKRISYTFIALQIVLFFSISLIYKIAPVHLLWFSALTGGFHAFITFLLLRMQKYFVLEKNGQALTHMNLANILTFLRLSFLPTIMYLLFLNLKTDLGIPVVIITAAAFITDYFDGKISRTRGEITKIGKMLDSSSDYLVITLIGVALMVYGALPPWLFITLFIRELAQTIFVTILSKVAKEIRPETTFLGKAAVFSVMVVFVLETFKFLPWLFEYTSTLIWYAEIICGIVLVISLIDKILWFIRRLRFLRKEEQGA
jgi:CDP-diacylglycerol--glycerol-3-phosphate 3-phosphatidyltransferase